MRLMPRKRSAALIQKPEYLVEILGRRFPVAGMLEASRFVSEVRDRSGAGASEMGGQFPIYENGTIIGYVSYNGKVWRGHPDDWKNAELMYDPYAGS